MLTSTNKLKAEYHHRIMEGYAAGLNASLNVRNTGKKPSELVLSDYKQGLDSFRAALFERTNKLMREFEVVVFESLMMLLRQLSFAEFVAVNAALEQTILRIVSKEQSSAARISKTGAEWDSCFREIDDSKKPTVLKKTALVGQLFKLTHQAISNLFSQHLTAIVEDMPHLEMLLEDAVKQYLSNSGR